VGPYLTVPTAAGAALGAHVHGQRRCRGIGPHRRANRAPPLSCSTAVRSPAGERARRRGGQRRRCCLLLQAASAVNSPWCSRVLGLGNRGRRVEGRKERTPTALGRAALLAVPAAGRTSSAGGGVLQTEAAGQERRKEND
jgi:hypothetical protein